MNKEFLTLGNLLRRYSISRSLTLWYLLAIVIGGLAFYYVYDQNKQIRNTTKTVAEYNHAISSICLKLEGELNQWSYLNYNYLIVKQLNSLKRAEGIWEQRIIPFVDSLRQLVNNQSDNDMINRATDLRKKIYQLQEINREFVKIKIDSLERNLSFIKKDKDFDLLLSKTQKGLRNISAMEETKLRFAMADTQEKTIINDQIFFFATLSLWLIGIVSAILLIQSILRFNSKVATHIDTLINGNIPPDIEIKKTELLHLRYISNELSQSYLRLKKLAEDVGGGNFATQIRPFRGRGVLGASITKMRESLQTIVNESEERIWFNVGFAKFAEILRTTSRDSELFYDTVISNLVKYLEIAQGGIFAVHEHEPGVEDYMELKASYAFNRKKYLRKKITREEGLIGQVWREKDVVYITDIPEDYSEIASGLGQAKPRSIFVVPLILNDEVTGALELTSFEPFQHRQMEFVKRISESIASTIARLNVDTETKRLLGESQEMAERMLAQEEEMRQSMDQLVFAQEKIEENAKILELEIKTLKEYFLNVDINSDGFIIDINELVLKTYGYVEKELLNKHFTILLGEQSTHESVERDWRRVNNGYVLQGEYIRFTKFGQQLWINEIIYPVYGLNGKISKIKILGYDITKQKEQEKNLKIQINNLQMSKRDVVNRIREIENKSKQRILKVQEEYIEQIKEKDKLISQLSKSIN
jgi:PAS domain S-box-containing protein